MLYNINTNSWDNELLSIFGVPSQSCLPEIKSSAGSFGVTKSTGVLPDGIPVSGILGDQQAALAGQACLAVGEAKCTFGTGAFLLLNTGHKAVAPGNGIVTTVAWNIDGKLTYALEGSSFIAGAAVQFIRDQFNFLSLSKDSEAAAFLGNGAPELYFVPSLAGLSAPWWNPTARGAFLGMHRGTTKNDIIRAALEGIALQVADLATAMKSLLGDELKVLRADGGAAANKFLMQFQADLLNTPVDIPRDIESTAIGAALFAGLGVGIYKTTQDLALTRVSDKIYNPTTLFDYGQTDDTVYSGATKTNPIGLYYQAHHGIKLRELSPYLETAKTNQIYNLPENTVYDSDENVWRWRDLYTHGYIDPDGIGTNFPYVNNIHYIKNEINLYLRNERYYTNKQNGVDSFNSRTNTNNLIC
jgi:glycerol kinase